MALQFEPMEAVTISTMNSQIPGVSQPSPVPTLQAGLLQPHVMAQQVRIIAKKLNFSKKTRFFQENDFTKKLDFSKNPGPF